MNRVKELFRVEKPVIALLHLMPLPGDPGYDRVGGMRAVVQRARFELKALQEGGVDGIMFANEFSLPYQSPAPTAIVAAMAYIIGELRSEIKVPFGVNVVMDSINCMELAGAVEADFARSMFTGAYVGVCGTRNTNIAGVMRRKHELNRPDTLMFYMVNPESDANLAGTDNKVLAKIICFHCNPDALCISGLSAGSPVDLDAIRDVQTISGGVPVFCNTGCHCGNVRSIMAIADGAFVGTGFKVDRKFQNAVDPQEVEKFMKSVFALREAKEGTIR